MLHRLCGPPSIPLSFNLAVVLPRRIGKSGVKSHGLTVKLPLILPILSSGEVDGIPGVAVKCVEIGRKAGGEGGALERF